MQLPRLCSFLPATSTSALATLWFANPAAAVAAGQHHQLTGPWESAEAIQALYSYSPRWDKMPLCSLHARSCGQPVSNLFTSSTAHKQLYAETKASKTHEGLRAQR